MTHLDGAEVADNLLAHVCHVGDGVCAGNEVAIRVTHELAQLVFLHSDVLPRLELNLLGVLCDDGSADLSHLFDLGNGLLFEQAFSIAHGFVGSEAAIASAIVGSCYLRHAGMLSKVSA